MSTLPGQASKGEKTKQKYQSLDINSLYNRVSRGENPEKQQQKSSSSYIKHGMQSLGKVPNARRPPANLPSLKSEHSGTDAAVPLVPPGAQGWGKQESTTCSPSTSTQQTPTSTTAITQNPSTTTVPSNQQPPTPPQLTAHQAAIALPVTNPVPHTHKQSQHSAQIAPTDKLWSSVTSGFQDGAGGGGSHPPLYHSPQFQHEFPSLSSGDGGPTRTGLDALPYPTPAGGSSTGGAVGLSLRPQTEGSWTQGGQRGSANAAADANGGPGRQGTAAPLGGPPQLPPQVGLQQQPFPPQIRGVMPPFMYKGSGYSQGPGIGIQNQNTVAPQHGPPVNGRSASRPMESRPPRLVDREQGEEVVSRPIIREEELSRMDEISKDAGWAESDEIDYNQKLAFSDDESEKPTKNEITKRHQHQQAREQKDERYDNHSENQGRQWNTVRSNNARGRPSEEEDIWMQRRSQTDKQVEIAVQRAKQRKEEEEKRFNEERKQGSAKKLMELEEKIQKRDKDNQEGVGTINPSTIPAKPINPVDIPLPDFQRDKERDKENIRDREHRSRTPNETVDDRARMQNQETSFRQLTQIEGKHFTARKHPKPNERDQRDRDRDIREQNGPNFSRSFKEDLPPRFTKQQRSNSGMNVPPHQFDRGWNQNVSKPQQPNGQYNQPPMHRNIRHSPDIERERDEEDRREYKRQSSEESYRSSNHSQEIAQKLAESQRYHEEHLTRHVNYESQSSRKDQEEEKRHKEKEMRHQDKDSDDHGIRHAGSENWNEKKDKFRDEKPPEKIERERERPQRPDSRDSRSTRHPRDSEPRDYKDWSESYETTYEEKRRDHHIREDRRVVPGPITKDRIEADDLRNEKRNLTQLKRGQPFEVKSEKKNDQTESKKEDTFVSAWADSMPAAIEAESAKLADDKKSTETHKLDSKAASHEPAKKPDRNDEYSRNRPYSKKSYDYHHQRWPKRSSSRGQRSNRGSHGSDHHHVTDSDASIEDNTDQKSNVKNESQKSDQKSPKPVKKFDKDEKNRDNKQEKYISDQRKYDKPDRRDSNYIPKGEPSRHGRGGGNFRSTRGGISRRIDGYGPPPSKSPFGHHDEREKDRRPEDHHQSESPPAPQEDKTKQNQQALAAGIAGKRNEPVQTGDKARSNLDNRPKTGKPRGKDEFCDTNSENSDEKNKDSRKLDNRKMQPSRPSNRSRNAQPPRLSGDKRSYESPRMENTSRQNSNGSLKKEDGKQADAPTSTAPDLTSKNKDGDEVEDKEEKTSINGDSEGFQEVKSKKNVKDRQKPADEKQTKPANKTDVPKEPIKSDRDRDRKPSKGNFCSQQLTQQQIQNIPKLMETPVNPPPILPQPKTSSFPRDRQPKLAPRFAKQKMKAQFQQQQHQMHNMGDMNDLNKPTQNMGMYTMKESNVPPQSVTTCAWDKPLGPPLRNIESENILGVSIDTVKSLDRAHSNSQGNSPNNEKIMNKPSPLQDKSLLDGTTPPVNTIIFENTNYKSTPGNRNARNEKPRSKLEESNIESSVMTGFNKPSMNELLQNKADNKSEAIQLPLFKEDSSDMKLDFFSPDLQFTDDKKNLCITSKSIHAITSGNNTVDSLDIKIASVKKVWETSEQEGEDNQITFVGPSLDSNVFSQGKDTPDDNHEVYSPSPNQTASTTTNVCKVKPTQQVSGSGQTVLNSTSHQPHSGIVGPGLMGNPLSPPPMPPVLGANVGLGPQQFTANQHIGYPASLSGSTQYGISAIPSPPTVPLVYNSTQPLQAAAAQTPVPYGAFQIDGVLGGQGRNQFSQYPSYHSLSQTASSPYSAQSVYLQTAPPHPPTGQAPPELYPNINNYRLSATAPFGQNQQLNNPTTVLISSTSNSLMSASVKPSNQPISAIGTYLSDLSLGTKAGGVGQAYQQQSQQGQQVYMAYEPAIQANYLAPSASVLQRGPAGPVQNNVVPALQPSSSFYSGSTGAQTGYFQQPGSSTISSAQLQQHQAASFGLQGNVFGTPNQSHTNTGLQNFNSHFLTTPMQVAAALNAQQYRSNLPAAYIKGVNTQMSDQASRAQQLKSPSSQEVLSSVFNTGPQIPSPKSRQNPKHPPPQSSPTSQHKYNLYPGMGQQNQNVQRYPTPIQRPVNFQQMQGNAMNQKHRNNPNNNKAPGRQYYGAQNNSLSVQNEKPEDSKINENVALSSTNSTSGTNKTATIGTTSTNSVNSTSEKVKDNIKEEPAALKE